MEQMQLRNQTVPQEKVTFSKPYLLGTRDITQTSRTSFTFNEEYLIHSFLIGACLLVLYSLAMFVFNVSMYFAAIYGLGALLAYVSIIFFLLQPRRTTLIEKTIARDIAYPSLKETTNVVEKEVIKFIEKPVIQYITRTVEKKVKRKSLKLPHYKYIASTQTRRYHKTSCRLGKLIKKKYKLHANSQSVFKKKRFKSCKKCIQKK